MSLLDFFKSSKRKSSAAIAKDRLQIIVAHERGTSKDTPTYLPKLQKELLEVVRKYVRINDEAISVNYEQEDNQEILELNIVLPDDDSSPKKKKKKK